MLPRYGAADRHRRPSELAQFWVDPGPTPRDLFDGVGGAVRPATERRFDVLERDTGGFSMTYRVRDQRGAEWSVKIGPEAQTEVVASRIVWAVGYHQLPSYFVERWIAVDHAQGADARRGAVPSARRPASRTGAPGRGSGTRLSAPARTTGCSR